MVGPGVAPRVAAYGVLRDVSGGGYADRSAAIHFESLTPADRRLAQQLAFGAIRLRGRLDTELKVLVGRPLKRLDPTVLDGLRLGLFQLRETRIPAHAAVSATLDAVHGTMSVGARGLLNAVLRRAAREGRNDQLFPALDRDPVGHLVSWGSHPEWLVRRWLERWSLAEVERLIENDNRPPSVTLRLLDAPATEEDRERLASVGLERIEEHPRMVRLTRGSPKEAMSEAHAIVQDPAASSVVDYVSKSVEGSILDVCAAPGGKTLGLWFATSVRPVIAADVHPERLTQVKRAAAAVGAEPLMLVMDGRFPAVRTARNVVLDVPCSGTGVLRRRPDARWRLTAGRIEALVLLQRELLEAAAGIVDPGGLLVYATCSLEAEENEQQVDDFLVRHPEFERDADEGANGRDLFIAPWNEETDGAFASRLRKRRGG